MPEEDKSNDALIRAMEAEVAQKRAQWERDRETHQLIRLLSFSFLSLVILGALLVLFFFFSRAGEMHSQRAPQIKQMPSPQSSP